MTSKRRNLQSMRTPTIVTIDPGVEIGWAVWSREHWTTKRAPIATGVITRRAPQWGLALKKAVRALFKELDNFWIVDSFMEWPAFFESSKGQVTARSEALVKLSCGVGWIAGYLDVRDIDNKFIPVNQWKGQLTKPAVERRIKRILGADACKGFTSHDWDAVGLGLYAQGLFS